MTLKRGHDLPEHSRQEGDVPVVSSSGITGRHKEAKATAPGVVTGRYGTIGEVYFLQEDFWPLNTALYVIDFKGNDPRFVSYFLRNVLKGYQSEKAAIPGVDRNVLHEIKVHLPSLPEQLRITEILSTYDDLIDNNRRRMALLEDSARQLYREWFVRLRFPGHEHTPIVDGVPQGWSMGTVSDFYETSSGGTPSRKIPEYFTGDIPWVKTQELSNGFITETSEQITEDALKNSSAKLFPKRTVLIALYGATVGELGITAFTAATNQACCAVLKKDPRGHFAHAFLFFRENKDVLVSLSAGAAQKNISQQIVRGVPMLMPANALMSMFTEIVSPVFDQILNLQLTNQKLRQARDLLLPRLMSGELAV
jgi:type I restriction enzyme S subunit